MRSVSRRGLLVAGGGLAVGAALAGCGSNTGRGSAAGLSQWYHQYGEPGAEAAAQRYARAYHTTPITVQWRPGDYDQQIAAALLTDDGPDVFESSGPSLDQIQGGQVVELTELLGSAASDFNPIVIGPKTYRGQVYGIPQSIDMQLLCYRKSMLARAGVTPPQTLDELVEAAQRLTTPDVKGLFLGNDGGAGACSGTVVAATGSQLITDDGAAGFDNRGVAAAFGKLHTLYANKSLLLGAPLDWSNPAAFNQGLTAMQWTGLWALPTISKALGDDYGVLPFPPDGPKGVPAVPVGAYACSVNARSRRISQAKDYVKWLWVDRTDFQEDFALNYGFHIPARTSLAARAAKLRSGPAADAVRLATDHGYGYPPLPWTPTCRTGLQDALSRIITSGADPTTELATLLATVRAELDRQRKKN